MPGSVTVWNDATGMGEVTEDAGGTHCFKRASCTQRLQDALKDRAIPPGASVRVKFDVAANNDAIDVDLPGRQSMTGSVTVWNDATGMGEVTEDAGGTHFFERASCTQRLQDALKNKAIPPGTSVRVKFDVAVNNDAINIDLT